MQLANFWMLKEFLINSAFHSDLHIQTNMDGSYEGIVSIARVLFNILKTVTLDVDLDIPVYILYTIYYILNGHIPIISKMYLYFRFLWQKKLTNLPIKGFFLF